MHPAPAAPRKTDRAMEGARAGGAGGRGGEALGPSLWSLSPRIRGYSYMLSGGAGAAPPAPLRPRIRRARPACLAVVLAASNNKRCAPGGRYPSQFGRKTANELVTWGRLLRLVNEDVILKRYLLTN